MMHIFQDDRSISKYASRYGSPDELNDPQIFAEMFADSILQGVELQTDADAGEIKMTASLNCSLVFLNWIVHIFCGFVYSQLCNIFKFVDLCIVGCVIYFVGLYIVGCVITAAGDIL